MVWDKKKIAEFGGFTFFFGQQSVGRSLTLRFSAYFGRVQPVLEKKKCVDRIGQSIWSMFIEFLYFK